MPLADMGDAGRQLPFRQPSLPLSDLSEETKQYDGSVLYDPYSTSEAPDNRDCSDELAHANVVHVLSPGSSRDVTPCVSPSRELMTPDPRLNCFSKRLLPDGEIDIDAYCTTNSLSPFCLPEDGSTDEPMATQPAPSVPQADCGRRQKRTNTVQQYKEPQQTLIALDWDDTLLPATWLREQNLASTLTPCSDPDHLAALSKLESAVCQLLTTAAMMSSYVIILTNANRPWVTESAQTYMPKVYALLEQANAPRIVYARESWQKKMRNTPVPVRWRDSRSTQEELDAQMTMAKIFALKQQLQSFYSQYPGQSWKNVLSVGDALHEIHAVQEVCFMHEQTADKRLRSKAIKLRSCPSLEDMRQQADQLEKYLRQVVFHDGDIDVAIEVLEEALSWKPPEN